MTKFHFVDFAARYQKGFRNHVRYGCMDPIRRMFCPLRDYDACRRFVAEASGKS